MKSLYNIFENAALRVFQGDRFDKDKKMKISERRAVNIYISLALTIVLICLLPGGDFASIASRRKHSGEIENYLR